MQKSIDNPKTHELSVISNFFNNHNNTTNNNKHLITPTPSHDQFNQFLTLHTTITDAQPLLSPSYLFTSKNKANPTASNQATPNSLTSQVTFSYPEEQPQAKHSTIQNLTAQFMMNEEPRVAYKTNTIINQTGESLPPVSSGVHSTLKKGKSKSDTNLYYESGCEGRTCKSIPPFDRVETKKILTPTVSEELGSLLQQRRLTSIDIREARSEDGGQQKQQTATSGDGNSGATVKMGEFIQTLSGSVKPVDVARTAGQGEGCDVVKAYLKGE
jgi:hypothetical protein